MFVVYVNVSSEARSLVREKSSRFVTFLHCPVEWNTNELLIYDHAKFRQTHLRISTKGLYT